MVNVNTTTKPVVLITGGANGIGEATAKLLVECDYTVFVTSRTPAQQTDRRLEALRLEVTSDASVAACVEAVLARAGRLDVLVNNIGTGIAGAAEETDLGEAMQVHKDDHAHHHPNRPRQRAARLNLPKNSVFKSSIA